MFMQRRENNLRASFDVKFHPISDSRDAISHCVRRMGLLLLFHNMPLILSMLRTTTSKHKFIREKPRILQDFCSYILLLFFSYIQILFRVFGILFREVFQLLFYYSLFAPVHGYLAPGHL